MSTTKSPGEVARNSKAERSLRKKENSKKRKSEAKDREEEENQLLDKMCALAVEEKKKNDMGMSTSFESRTDETADDEDRSVEDGELEVSTTDGESANRKKIPEAPPQLHIQFKETPEKGGIGAFARHSIKQGTEILVEAAIIGGANSGKEWLYKEALFKVLSAEKQERILALHSQCNCKSTPCLETPLMKVWDANAYAAAAGPMLYGLASRFNHACLPNVARGFSREEYIVLRAARDIKKGEELTVNYILSPCSAEARREQLRDKFGFVCKCAGCESDHVYTISDLVDATLPRGVEANSPAVGKQTGAEIAAQAKVGTWFKNIEATLKTVQENLYRDLVVWAGEGDSCVADEAGRAGIVECVMDVIDVYLRRSNAFDLDEEFFEKYRARNTPSLIALTEQNYAAILEDLEEVRRLEENFFKG